MTIWLLFYFTAPVVNPWMIGVFPAEYDGQKKKPIVASEQRPLPGGPLLQYHLVGFSGLLEVAIRQLLPDHLGQRLILGGLAEVAHSLDVVLSHGPPAC